MNTEPDKDQVSINSFSERRRIREQLQRSNEDGVSLDPAIKCKCPDCGSVHYKPKSRVEEPVERG